MTPPTKKQYGAIHLLVVKLGMTKDAKESMVASYTGDGNKVSCKDLTFDQAQDMITKLNELCGHPASPAPVDADADKIARENIRKRIIAICYNLGWHKTDDDGVMILKDGKKQIDITRINQYCLEHTAAHKAFNKLSKEELQVAAYQFGEMQKNYLQPKKNNK